MKSGLGRKFAGLVLAVFGLAAAAAAVDVRETRMLTNPAIGKSRIAFQYANDLWAADQVGRNVRRLTSDLGLETNPAFSPDGSLIAFSAQYDGNIDVYVVPAAGGIPKRLTWHPGADLVQSFTNDGRAVLFTSARSSFTGAFQQLYTVPVEGGFPEALKIPYAMRASLSPDGARIAYNPLPDAFTQWKNYRGGRNSVIWIVDLKTYALEKVPQPEGRANDPQPMWVGDRIYFRSDRNGEFNLFSYDPKTKAVEQLTRHKDFPVLSAAGGDGKIIYEQAGELHLFDPRSKSARRLAIGIATDLNEVRPRFVRGARWVRDAGISPSGARAVFEFRGEIVTVPAEKGDPRNLTLTPAVHERAPAWSPDGKSIAYFSDASGEYELHVRPQDGSAPAKTYTLAGHGFYDSAVWSPDGKKIAYADNSMSLYWIDLASGVCKKIGQEALYAPLGLANAGAAWSPDSRWIAYSLGLPTYFRRILVYSLDKDQSFPITDGLSEAFNPVFDASGQYLYFLASTDAGPNKQWFDMSNADMRSTSIIYVAALTKEAPNPLVRESDEEKAAPEKPAAPPAKDKPAETAVRFDFEGLDHRIVALPVPKGSYRGLAAGEAGQIFYLENPPDIGSAAAGAAGGSVHRYDFKSRKDEIWIAAANGFELSADRKKIFFTAPGGNFFIGSVLPKPAPGQGRLAVDAIEVRVDPPAEWRQIFDEAWRINRDYFYDPGFHGCDWPAMKKKYEVFLPDLACRGDLNRLIQWMCSELAVGHHRVGGGDSPYEARTVPAGLLGADYAVENGRFRFKKVYGGLNWNPELRSPLTEPGVDVRAGEYLLAVNGRELRPPANLYSFFENTAGKIVELSVGANPDGAGARTVRVVPIANEGALRNRDWVEGNLRAVDKASGGRVAYVYVPNTSTLGHEYFKRYFYPQADRDAIIVDERFNGGGSVADYYIDQLRKPLVSYWAMRYGGDLKTPGASIQGPKVMLINEIAGSGGDLLPWMWRKFKLGPLVGKRTWGGLVGTLGFPILMDGGIVTAPNLAIWTEEGFIVENVGVPPDVEVEQNPADLIAGRDPQLEKAIQMIMDELAKNPPQKVKRPAYPIRVRKD